MPDRSFFDTYSKHINKEVSCRFRQETLSFFLSQELFSSFDIDTGTRQLLAMLANTIDFSSLSRVLDIGCGTGIIAVSIAKTAPNAAVFALDRDALACKFTEGNADHNQAAVTVSPGLDGEPGDSSFPHAYDLIVSNLPAKAGRPVLRRMVQNSLAGLTPDGKFACVIVAPLKHILQSIFEELGVSPLVQEHHQKHSVFLLPMPEPPLEPDSEFPGPYHRLTESFPAAASKKSYKAETVYDIPGFNTVPYQAALLGSVVSDIHLSGTQFFWNPGQGHLPLQVLSSCNFQDETAAILLAGRDLLALKISRKNLLNALPRMSIGMLHCPDIPSALRQSGREEFGGIWIDLQGTAVLGPDGKQFLESLPVSPGSFFGTAASSSCIASLPKRISGLQRYRSKKSNGFRAVLFRCIAL